MVTFNLSFAHIKLEVYDDINFRYFHNFPYTTIDIEDVRLENPDILLSPSELDDSYLQYFDHIKLFIGKFAVLNNDEKILSTSLELHLNQFLIKNFPTQPELIVDLHIPYITVDVRPSLL